MWSAELLELMAAPKNKDIQVIDLKFIVDTKNKVIKGIEYSDELQNKTAMRCSQVLTLEDYVGFQLNRHKLRRFYDQVFPVPLRPGKDRWLHEVLFL